MTEAMLRDVREGRGDGVPAHTPPGAGLPHAAAPLIAWSDGDPGRITAARTDYDRTRGAAR